jgi:hypothetical protein
LAGLGRVDVSLWIRVMLSIIRSSWSSCFLANTEAKARGPAWGNHLSPSSLGTEVKWNKGSQKYILNTSVVSWIVSPQDTFRSLSLVPGTVALFGDGGFADGIKWRQGRTGGGQVTNPLTGIFIREWRRLGHKVSEETHKRKKTLEDSSRDWSHATSSQTSCQRVGRDKEKFNPDRLIPWFWISCLENHREQISVVLSHSVCVTLLR